MTNRRFVFLFLFPVLFFVAGGDALVSQVGALTHQLFHPNHVDSCDQCVRFTAAVKAAEQPGLSLFQMINLEGHAPSAHALGLAPQVSVMAPQFSFSFLHFSPQPPTPPPNLLV